jgi:hypothetical protein
MQNMDGISNNEGTALRELSLDEAEMVGGGFGLGGLVHAVEHAGTVVGSGAAGFVGGTLARGVGNAAKWTLRRIKADLKAPEGPGPDDGGFFDDIPPIE